MVKFARPHAPFRKGRTRNRYTNWSGLMKIVASHLKVIIAGGEHKSESQLVAIFCMCDRVSQDQIKKQTS